VWLHWSQPAADHDPTQLQLKCVRRFFNLSTSYRADLGLNSVFNFVSAPEAL
jgi:hypothetical protein